MLSWVARSLTLTLRVFSNAFSILSFTSNLLVEVVGLFVVHLRLIFCPLWTNSSICALQFHLAHCDRLISQVHYEQHLESNIRDHPTLSRSKKTIKKSTQKNRSRQDFVWSPISCKYNFFTIFHGQNFKRVFFKTTFYSSNAFFWRS